MIGEPVAGEGRAKETEPIDESIDVRKAVNRLDEMRKALEEERSKAEDYLNHLRYLQADFDNYKKRVDRDMLELVKYGNERLIVKLLDTVDDLERAILSGKEAKGKDALLKGVEIVLKELKDTLGKEGLEEIDAVGDVFNPNLHDAVDRIETNDYPNNTIAEEIRKGYLLNGKLIRPSMVKVAVNSLDKE
ncbi:MAG: nucleotide exchange factor GrpE [Candidatus Methylarchaceae archaeon HK01B]|nr:nucleotide exchange factor GrpE [Candidatus Methylarchaceae archaeon HK01M]MCP8312716.1 nucleotide exchange factor GrpE [Candidatus Methylarchaceae archaeon HK02M1]MCP8319177.1 nucleotide exchange factor GrpE [Candidatus Methylarchaceae archaeon HK01B]